ncbi:hypothetical protein FOA52_011790, partial [Chlamydomonas sp. UWO 241]
MLVLSVDPADLTFDDVQFGQVYTQTIYVTNTLKGQVEASIKPGASERFSVSPSTVKLKGNETAAVEVKLRVLKFAQRQKAVEQGQRDVFHIKANFFDQKFYATFFLASDAQEPTTKLRSPSPSVSTDTFEGFNVAPAAAAAASVAAAAALGGAPASVRIPTSLGATGAPPPTTGRAVSPLSPRALVTSPRAGDPCARYVVAARALSPRGPATRNPGDPVSYQPARPPPESLLPSGMLTSLKKDNPPPPPPVNMEAELAALGLRRSADAPRAASAPSSAAAAAASAAASAAGQRPRSPSPMRGVRAARTAAITTHGSPPSRAVSQVLQALDAMQLQRQQSGGASRSSSPDQRGNVHPGQGSAARPASPPPRARPALSSAPAPRSPSPVRPLGAMAFPAAGRPSPPRAPISAATAASPVGVGARGARDRSPDRAPHRADTFAQPRGASGASTRDRSPDRGQHRPGTRDSLTFGEPPAASGVSLQDRSPGQRGARIGEASAALRAALAAAGAAGSPARPGQRAEQQQGQQRQQGQQQAHAGEAAEALASVVEQAAGDTSQLTAALRAAARREQLLRSTVASQQQGLKDKDDILDAMRSRLAVAQASLEAERSDAEARTQMARGGGGGGGAPPLGSAAQEVAHQNSELVAANQKLSSQVKEMGAQLEGRRTELASLRRVVLEVQARVPDVARAIDAALSAEQAAHEVRNRRALELLHQKDAALKAAEARCGQLEGEVRRLTSARADALQRADAGEAHVVEVLGRQEEARAEAQHERRAYVEQLASLEAQLSDMARSAGASSGAQRAAAEAERQAQALAAQVDALREELHSQAQVDADLQAQSTKLLQRLAAADVRADAAHRALSAGEGEGAARLRAVAAEHAAQAQVLEARVEELSSALEAARRNGSTAGELSAARAAAADAERARGGSGGPATARSERDAASDSSGAGGGGGGGRPAWQGGRGGPAARGGGGGGAARDGGGGGGGGGVEGAQSRLLAELTRDIAEREFALRASSERVAQLEAALSVAQQANARGDEASAGTFVTSADVRRLESEAELSRATATRLNARVNELVAAEQAALERAEQAAAASRRQADLHRRDMTLLEQRLQDVATQLADAGAGPGGDGGGSGEPGSSGCAPSTTPAGVAAAARLASGSMREDRMRSAVEAAEAAVAVVQGRLMDALRAKADLAGEVAVVRRDHDRERARLQDEVRAAREDGSLRIRNLEEALARLGREAKALVAADRSSAAPGMGSSLPREGRITIAGGEPAGAGGSSREVAGAQQLELVQVVAEADAAKRLAARLQGELEFALGRVDDADRRTDEALRAVRAKDEELSSLWAYGLLLAGVDQSPSVGVGVAEAGASPYVSAAAVGGGGAGGGGGGGQPVLLDPGLERRLRGQMEDLASKQQIIARLADQAERFQYEAEDARSELEVLRAQTAFLKAPGGGGKGGGDGLMDLQRALAKSEVEGSMARDAREAAEMTAAQTQAALDECRREAATLRASLQQAGRDVDAARDAAARRGVAVSGSMASEVAALSRRASDAEADAAAESVARREAHASAEAARADAAAAARVLGEAAAVAAAERTRWEEEAERLREALCAARRDAGRAAAEAAERKAQAAVLMDTVETLSAGGDGERAQRMVALSAQLAAARTGEAVLEVRCAELLVEAESRGARTAQLATQLRAAAVQAGERDAKLAAAEGARESLARQAASLREDARSRSGENVRLSHGLDSSEQRCSAVEGELEGVRRALEDCQSRHADQVAFEREEAAQAVRHARAEALLGPLRGGVGGGGGSSEWRSPTAVRVEELLEELVQQVSAGRPDGPEGSSGPGPDSGPGSGSGSCSASSSGWAPAVVSRLKGIALNAWRGVQVAEVDARIAREEVVRAGERIAHLSRALDTRTADWTVAEVARAAAVRGSGRRSELAARHASEAALAYEERLSSLQAQLQDCTQQLAVVAAEAAQSSGALAAERARAGALERQLHVTSSERSELCARLAAGQMEAAGSVQPYLATRGTHGGGSGAGRGAGGGDAGGGNASPAAMSSGGASAGGDTATPGDVESLTRELCACRQVISQMQAALASTRMRSDAATLLAAGLSEGVRSAEARASALSGQIHHSSSSSGSGAPGGRGGGSSPEHHAAGAARLRIQLVASARELAAAEDTQRRLRQALERRELDVSELQAQMSAAEMVTQQVRDEGTASLLQLRDRLSSAHDADRALLLREMAALQSRVAGLRALVAAESEQSEQRVRSVAATLDVELDKRMQAALQGYVEAGKLTSAEARAGAAERERDRLRGLADALQDEVACLKGQVGELGDAAELTTSAVAGLEATLQRIERSASAAAAGGPHGAAASAGAGSAGLRAGGGARRVSVGGAGAGIGVAAALEMEGGLGGLSRELVRSKLAEAEAVKKMRASARSEVELRSKILQRDQRIAELKDALVVKTKAYEDARRRLLDTVASTQPATAGSGRAGSAPRARGGGGAQVTSGSGASGGGGGAGSRLMAPTASSRAHQGAAGAPRSPRDTDTDTRAGSRADQGRTRGGDARARTRSLSPPQARDDYADYHGASAENCGGGDRLSSRLAAASSSVEVERLRAALAEANAGAGIPGMRAQLAQ